MQASLNDMEHWMTNLPPKLKTTPIIDLAIPGSHDSATSGITNKSRLSPDAEPAIRRLRFTGPLLRAIMVRWCRTQTATVGQQLLGGVRYLDFRIATKAKNDSFYLVHGMYSDEVEKTFEEVKSFLEGHPKEVVILDCQHFYAFQQSDHERLMYLLTSTYGHKLLPYTCHMKHISLQYMTDCRYQVMVIYRSDAARFGQPLLWPSACFPTPWADTPSIPTLIAFLADRLERRDASVGFISQCVLTPTPWFIIKHLFSTLKKQCLLPLEMEKYRWLKAQKPGRGGLNVVISDFVEHEGGAFPRAVVGLNERLLHSDGGKMTPIQ